MTMDWRQGIRRAPRRMIWLAAGVALLLVLIVGVIFDHRKIAPGLLSEITAANSNEPTEVVARQVVPIRREVVGSVQSVVPVDASSRVSAAVIAVKVNAGDRVRRGEILVELDSAEGRAQVAQAQGALAAAQAELTRSAADFKRYSGLLKRGAVTASEYDGAQAADQAAAGNVARATAAVEAAHAALAYSTVRSPVDGVVVARMVEPGDMAMPGKILVRLYDDHALRVELTVPDQLAGQVRVGMQLEVAAGAPARNISTRVSEVVPAADPASRSFIVRAPLPAGMGLRPGTFARANFEIGEERLLSIPRTAVQSVGQLSTVRVIVRGAVEVRQVALGRALGNRVEVLAGLNEGDRVLSNPSRQESNARQ